MNGQIDLEEISNLIKCIRMKLNILEALVNREKSETKIIDEICENFKDEMIDFKSLIQIEDDPGDTP